MGLIIEYITGLFFKEDIRTGNKNINWLPIVVIVVIILPLIYFTYTGVNGLIHNVFNIKTKKEIIVEQKNTIHKIINANLALHKTVELQNKINKVDIKSIVKLNKDITKATSFKNKIKQDLNDMSKPKYVKLKKQVKVIRKMIPKKVHIKPIKTIKEINTTKSFIINKEKYEVSGLNTFNNITSMYDNVVKDNK